MNTDDIHYVTTSKTHCDGGKGSLGHPKIYLNMGDKKEIFCPYCSKHFVRKEINHS